MTEKTAVSREDVLATITEQLASFGVDASTVTAESAFDTLGLDSLDLVELSVKIEDEYGLDIEEEDLKEVVSIGDAVNLVIKKLAVKA